MKSIPLVRAAALLPALTFLKEIGAPVDKLLAAARLPATLCNTPEVLVSLHQSGHFAEQAAHSQGVEHFGLHIGQRARFEDLGTFGRLVCNSLTLHEAIATATRLISAHNSGERVWLAVRGEQAALCHRTIADIDQGCQEVEQYVLMQLVNLIRLAAGTAWRPREIHLQTGPVPGLNKFETLAETRLVFNQPATTVLLPRELLSLPMKRPGNRLAISSETETDLWSSAPAGDFAGSVRQVLVGLLQDGYPDVNLVAEVAGMSVRTFQRRLADAGLSYGRLVEQVRFEKAVRLLARPDIPLLEIAFELGYTEAANFTRAFRRWTGVAPSEFRRLRPGYEDYREPVRGR